MEGKMRLLNKSLLFALSLLFASFANAFEWQWQYTPYLGLDAQWRRASFKTGFGDNLFAHIYPQMNGYIGMRLHENIGIEIGYEAARARTRITTLTTGDSAAGTPVPAILSPMVFRGKGKLKGPHLDLVGFYAPGDPCVELVGSVGVAYLTGRFERHTIQVRNTFPLDRSRTLQERKAVLRLGAGLQYRFWECLSIRGMLGWENTTHMIIFEKAGSSPEPIRSLFVPEIKLRNSTTYSLGLVWSFW